MNLHPLTAVRDALAYGVQLGAFGFFLGVMGTGAVDALPAGALVVLGPLGFLAGAGYGLARYLVFEYDLEGTTLHIRSGVFARQERAIPLGRIQNVDVHQSFVQRLLGLAVVRFETAGGGETEATLRLVTRTEAERLQADIRRRKRGDAREDPSRAAAGEPAEGAAGVAAGAPGAAEGAEGAAGAEGMAEEARAGEAAAPGAEQVPAAGEPAPALEPELLFELSFRDLLVLCGVSFRWGVLPVLVFAIPLADELLFRLGGRLLEQYLETGDPLAVSAGTVLVGVSGLLVALLVAWVVSGAITFVRYFGFRLERLGDELRYERGLLQRYSGTIPVEKVQALTVRENVLMRRLGYAALAVETAGYSPGGNGGGGRTPSAIPLAERATLLGLADDLEGVDDIGVERPPRRARRRYAGRFALVVLAATGVLFAVHRFAVPLGLAWALPLLALIVVPPAAHLRWANRGHRAGADHVRTRTGFWRRTTRIVPYYRVQTVVTERTLFQRRWDLASVVADTAASSSLLQRDAVAHDLDADDARELHATIRERLGAALAERRAIDEPAATGGPQSEEAEV